MDISKASNFERFIFDLVGRDAAALSALWRSLDSTGAFDLSADAALMARLRDSGFVSGRSTHADRVARIRAMYERYGVLIDTHTADGFQVAAQYREPGVEMVCLETAQPAKFAESIREAIGRDSERPASFDGLEAVPRRFEVVDASVDAVKRYIEQHVPVG